MRKGFTLVEMLASLFIIGMITVGSLTLLSSGLQGFTRTSTDADISVTNAQSVRHVVENLRQALSVTVSQSGKRIEYTLPQYSGANDATTGEKELTVPITSDGVARAYVIDFTTGKMTDTVTNKVVLSNISSGDLNASSGEYTQAYAPFELRSVGSVRAVSVNLVTKGHVIGNKRYARFKTTVIARNIR